VAKKVKAPYLAAQIVWWWVIHIGVGLRIYLRYIQFHNLSCYSTYWYQAGSDGGKRFTFLYETENWINTECCFDFNYKVVQFVSIWCRQLRLGYGFEFHSYVSDIGNLGLQRRMLLCLFVVDCGFRYL